MSTQIRRVTRARPPAGPTRLRAAGRFAEALAFAWTASAHRQELVTGAIADVSNVLPIGSPFGLAAQCATGQRNVEWAGQFVTTSNGVGTGDFTILVVANPSASGTVGHMFAQKNDAAGSPFAQMALLSNADSTASASSGSVSFFTFNGSPYGASAAGAIDGDYHVWVGVRNGAFLAIYKDGVLLAFVSGAAVNINQANRFMAVGSRGNGTTEAFGRDVLTAAAWNRALSSDEIAALGSIPSTAQIFGYRRKLWAVSAGVSTYTLSAPTYVPGSITSTGLTARVTVTAA